MRGPTPSHKELYNIAVLQVKTSPAPQNQCKFNRRYLSWQVTFCRTFGSLSKIFHKSIHFSPSLLSPWFMLSIFLWAQSWSSFFHALTLPIYCPKWISLYVVNIYAKTWLFHGRTTNQSHSLEKNYLFWLLDSEMKIQTPWS